MYGDLKREKTPNMFSTKKHRSIVALHGIELFDKDEKVIRLSIETFNLL